MNSYMGFLLCFHVLYFCCFPELTHTLPPIQVTECHGIKVMINHSPTGHVNAIGTMENIIDHIASYLKKDPLEVRKVNLITPGEPRLLGAPHENTPLKDRILPLLLEKANYAQRKVEVDEFNRVSLQSIYHFAKAEFMTDLNTSALMEG